MQKHARLPDEKPAARHARSLSDRDVPRTMPARRQGQGKMMRDGFSTGGAILFVQLSPPASRPVRLPSVLVRRRSLAFMGQEETGLKTS